eukprot:365647-Chlamydomonas_euryale.AAC.12
MTVLAPSPPPPLPAAWRSPLLAPEPKKTASNREPCASGWSAAAVARASTSWKKLSLVASPPPLPPPPSPPSDVGAAGAGTGSPAVAVVAAAAAAAGPVAGQPAGHDAVARQQCHAAAATLAAHAGAPRAASYAALPAERAPARVQLPSQHARSGAGGRRPVPCRRQQLQQGGGAAGGPACGGLPPPMPADAAAQPGCDACRWPAHRAAPRMPAAASPSRAAAAAAAAFSHAAYQRRLIACHDCLRRLVSMCHDQLHGWACTCAYAPRCRCCSRSRRRAQRIRRALPPGRRCRPPGRGARASHNHCLLGTPCGATAPRSSLPTRDESLRFRMMRSDEGWMEKCCLQLRQAYRRGGPLAARLRPRTADVDLPRENSSRRIGWSGRGARRPRRPRSAPSGSAAGQLLQSAPSAKCPTGRDGCRERPRGGAVLRPGGLARSAPRPDTPVQVRRTAQRQQASAAAGKGRLAGERWGEQGRCAVFGIAGRERHRLPRPFESNTELPGLQNSQPPTSCDARCVPKCARRRRAVYGEGRSGRVPPEGKEWASAKAPATGGCRGRPAGGRHICRWSRTIPDGVPAGRARNTGTLRNPGMKPGNAGVVFSCRRRGCMLVAMDGYTCQCGRQHARTSLQSSGVVHTPVRSWSFLVEGI